MEDLQKLLMLTFGINFAGTFIIAVITAFLPCFIYVIKFKMLASLVLNRDSAIVESVVSYGKDVF
jgi:hypothetical protein